MNTRLKQLRKILKLTQNEFGEKIGITGATVSDIERAKLSLTERNISLICEKLNVNREWLEHGTGDIFLPALPEDKFSALLADIDKNSKQKTKNFIELYWKLDEKSQSVIEDLAYSLARHLHNMK